jgi:hypothetical protein
MFEKLKLFLNFPGLDLVSKKIESQNCRLTTQLDLVDGCSKTGLKDCLAQSKEKYTQTN